MQGTISMVTDTQWLMILGAIALLSVCTLFLLYSLLRKSDLMQQENQAAREQLLAGWQKTQEQSVRAIVDESISQFRMEMTHQIQALGQAQNQQLHSLGNAQTQQMIQFSEVMNQSLSHVGEQNTQLRQDLQQNLMKMKDSQSEELNVFRQMIQQATQNSQTSSTQARQDLQQNLMKMSQSQSDEFNKFSQLIQQATQNAQTNNNQVRQELARNLNTLTENVNKELSQMRESMKKDVLEMRTQNDTKLEQMRATVEEKLQSTLETRLSESFKQVAAHLSQVEAGLGEMRTIAGQVGELKRVLTNVKTRGTFGEIQLGALLSDILTPDQFEANVITIPNTRATVEYAVKMPGEADGKPVWLPIDSKFPLEDWERLQDARERNSLEEIEEYGKAFERRLRDEAKKIQEKYVKVPYTTEFAILFLPTESLYAEALRRPGLAQSIAAQYRITIAGPSVLSSLLNSLQMGFRTLAIQKRSAEVWQVLGKVKSEFAKFNTVVDQISNQLQTVQNSIAKVRTRTNVMERELRGVESLPGEEKNDTIALPKTP